jgi:hypothetical protein
VKRTMCAPGSACSSFNQAAHVRHQETEQVQTPVMGQATSVCLAALYICCTHKCTHRPLAGWCTLALEGLGWAGAAPVSRAPEGGVVAMWHGIGLAEVGHAGHTHGHDQLAPRQLLVVQQRRPAGGDTRQEGRASVAGATGGARRGEGVLGWTAEAWIVYIDTGGRDTSG